MAHALFPYVVMRSDPDGRTPIATLSDGLHLALIHVTTEGHATIMFREELQAQGLDWGAAYLDSRERLMRLVHARLVRMRAVAGPSNVRCLAFDHSFLAASCAVLPDLFDLAHRQLRADSMILAIPRRDLLIVAPNLGVGFRKELTALLGTDESRVFSLDPSGPAWMSGCKPELGPANFSNDALPTQVASVDTSAVTRSPSGSGTIVNHALRPYQQTKFLIKKACA